MSDPVDYRTWDPGEYETVPEPGFPQRAFTVARCPLCGLPGRFERWQLGGGVAWHVVGDPDHGWRSREGRDFCVVARLPGRSDFGLGQE